MTNRVFLAVGHGLTPSGRHDPGATGGGWSEQTAGDVIVATAAQVLAAAGAQVRHEADRGDPNFVGTSQAANAWPADVVVAVHHDVHAAPAGSFAYYDAGNRDGARLAGKIIATIAADGRPTRPAWLGPGLGFHHGPVAPRGLHVLSHTRAAAVLLEVGPIGDANLDETDELAAFGRVLAAGIAAHLGLDLPDDDGATTPPASSPSTDDDQEFADMRLLKLRTPRNMTGTDVRAAQALLVRVHGIHIGPSGVDGWYGPQTERGVREFQRHLRIGVDGIVGPITRVALNGGDR